MKRHVLCGPQSGFLIRRENIGFQVMLCIKYINTLNDTYKIRFLLQGHINCKYVSLFQALSTVLQHSFKLLIGLSAIPHFRLCTQDLRQIYLQSAERL